MPRARPALLAACLISLSCTTTTQADPQTASKPDSRTDAGTEAADLDDPAASETKPERSSSPAAELPECPSDPAAKGMLAAYCTDAGELAGVWVPVDTLQIPDDVEIIFNVQGPDTTRQPALLIVLRDDELYIRQVTCGACRRVLGQGFAGQLSQLSPAQIGAVQVQLGLGPDLPALTTPEQWVEFTSGPKGVAALTTIASKTEGEVDGRGR